MAVIIKSGFPICRCALEPSATDRRFREIPEWMFDRAICELQQLTTIPVVNIDALFELKQLLESSSILMRNSGIVQSGRDILSMAGEAHAAVAASDAIPAQLVRGATAPGNMGKTAKGRARTKPAIADKAAAAVLEQPSHSDADDGAER